MIEPSEDNLDRMRTREVTGVFHSRKALIDAAEELLIAGIDRADIDVSASVDELGRRLNYKAIPAADLTDMPITPRQSFMGIDDVLNAEAVAGSIAGSIAAIAVAAILVARDTEPLYVGISSILGGFIVGGIAVTRIRRRLYRERTLGLEKQSEWQGLLIWVRVRSPEKEAEAQEVLIRHGGQAVHVHEIELATRSEDRPLHSLRVDPWLGDERLGRP
ncbi:MAG TPA: hypothetical protein VIQ05_18695 [Tardiphaga sp.]